MKKGILTLLFLLSACSTETAQNKVSDVEIQETGKKEESQEIMACDIECDEDETLFTDQFDFLIPISFQTFLNDIEEKKSGVYYFGFEDCPWCMQFLPVLDEVLQGEKIYYIKTRDENHELLYTQEQKEEAYSVLKEAMPENEDGEPTLYVPLLVVIKDGEVIGFHQGTLEDHDARNEQLTDTQKAELSSQLSELLQLADSVS